jgi:death-on-curing protein
VTEWRWLAKDMILAIHDEQLAEHGGRPGIRDMGLLESALARPLNRAASAEVTVSDLAAAYAFGIARNQPFVDGNKRVALLAAALFLIEHDVEFSASDDAVVTSMLSLADGNMDEGGFALWLRNNTVASGEAR